MREPKTDPIPAPIKRTPINKSVFWEFFLVFSNFCEFSVQSSPVSCRLVWIEFSRMRASRLYLKCGSQEVPILVWPNRISCSLAFQLYKSPSRRLKRFTTTANLDLISDLPGAILSNQVLVWEPQVLDYNWRETYCKKFTEIHGKINKILTRSSNSDCGGTSTNEFSGRVNIACDWWSLEWPDLWDQANWSCVLGSQGLALADDSTAQWSQGSWENLKLWKI